MGRPLKGSQSTVGGVVMGPGPGYGGRRGWSQKEQEESGAAGVQVTDGMAVTCVSFHTHQLIKGGGPGRVPGSLPCKGPCQLGKQQWTHDSP